MLGLGNFVNQSKQLDIPKICPKHSLSRSRVRYSCQIEPLNPEKIFLRPCQKVIDANTILPSGLSEYEVYSSL